MHSDEDCDVAQRNVEPHCNPQVFTMIPPGPRMQARETRITKLDGLNDLYA